MEAGRIADAEEWRAARKMLLAKEKAHMRAGDALAEERRALPWLRIDKPYAFDTELGRRTLAELFGQATQLIVHHFMFAPEWEAACPGCSFQAEHVDGPARHLEHHNVRIVAVSRAPLEKLLAYRARMGWHFPWVSSFGSDFNYDFHVSFRKEQVAAGAVDYNFGTITTDKRYVDEELPGVSVFAKNTEGQVFLTYATYARGLDALLDTDHYLDITPEGRNGKAYSNWPKRHDEYPQEGASCERCNEG
jgi:predicted dithiol-disulfide oxidoreductase (DUF899 family)